MFGEAFFSLIFIRRICRIEKRIEGRFGVYDDLTSPWQPNDEIGTKRLRLANERHLFIKVTLIDKSCQLYHATQMDLSPRASNIWRAKRLYELRSFLPELSIGIDHHIELLMQGRIGP